MSPKSGERRFDKSYSHELLQIAKTDLFAAKALAKNSKVRKETAIFLAQQCVEKSLKSTLCHFELPIPLVHDLGALIARMPEGVEPPFGYGLTSFNDYAGIFRYETGREKLTAKDVLEAMKIADKVYNWASKIVVKKK